MMTFVQIDQKSKAKKIVFIKNEAISILIVSSGGLEHVCTEKFLSDYLGVGFSVL